MSKILNTTSLDLSSCSAANAPIENLPAGIAQLLLTTRAMDCDAENRPDLGLIMMHIYANGYNAVILDSHHTVFIQLLYAVRENGFEAYVSRTRTDNEQRPHAHIVINKTDLELIDARLCSNMFTTTAYLDIIATSESDAEIVERMGIKYNKAVPSVKDSVAFLDLNLASISNWFKGHTKLLRKKMTAVKEELNLPQTPVILFGEPERHTIPLVIGKPLFLKGCENIFGHLTQMFGNPSAVPFDVAARIVIHKLINEKDVNEAWIMEGLESAFKGFREHWGQLLHGDMEFEWARFMHYAYRELVQMRNDGDLKLPTAMEMLYHAIARHGIKIDPVVDEEEMDAEAEDDDGPSFVFDALVSAYGSLFAVPVEILARAAFHYANNRASTPQELCDLLMNNFQEYVDTWALADVDLATSARVDYLIAAYEEIDQLGKDAGQDMHTYKDAVRGLYREYYGAEMPGTIFSETETIVLPTTNPTEANVSAAMQQAPYVLSSKRPHHPLDPLFADTSLGFTLDSGHTLTLRSPEMAELDIAATYPDKHLSYPDVPPALLDVMRDSMEEFVGMGRYHSESLWVSTKFFIRSRKPNYRQRFREHRKLLDSCANSRLKRFI